jgi:ribose transport system substrate-binding protein
MRFLSLIISLMIIISIFSACKQSSENKIVISVIPKGSTHIFWQSIHAGALKAGNELGVEISWVGPEKEDDRQQQIALIDNQVMNQVSGIVLAPIDDMALRRPVRSAVERGVPVVIIDSDLKDSEDIYISYIATDNKEGGRIAGRELSRLLEGRGKVIVLRESEGAGSTQARADGFVEAVTQNSKIEVVMNDQYVGVTKTLAQQSSENILLRFTNASGELTIDGVFCPNEATTYGMLQALRRKRLTKKIQFMGFDSSGPIIEGLQNGEIQGLVVQNPFKMGYFGVKTLVQSLKGEKVDKRMDTGVLLINNDNLDQPEIKDLLNPDLKKWLGE